MTEEQALVRGILERPADDTNRLVYADWLDDHSTPKRAARAELIRVQVESAQKLAITERWVATPSDQPGGTAEDGGPAGAALAESQILDRRANALLKKYAASWLPRVGRKEAAGTRLAVDGPRVSVGLFGVGYQFEFRRGFIERVAVDLLEHVAGDSQRQLKLGEMLVASPLSRVRITLQSHSPTVVIGIATDGTGWRLTVDAGDAEEGEHDVRVLSFVHESRANLLRCIDEQVMLAIKENIDFERIVAEGYGNGEDFEGQHEPSDGDDFDLGLHP